MVRGIFTAPTDNLGSMTSENTSRQTEGDGGDDGGGPAAAIAAGVTVPVLVVLLVAGIAYWYYRKKFPVRMILGRDFAKFDNPAYSRNQSGQTHTLVREDADAFFQQTQPTGPLSLVLGVGGGDDKESRLCYVNTGFQYDSQDADEEEVERRFRQQKAYLFKKDDDDGDGGDEVDHADDSAAGEEKRKKTAKAKVNGHAGPDRGHENAAFSGDSDDEGEKDAMEAGGKKDKTDAKSASSDVSSGSDKAGKTADSGKDAPQEVPADTPPTDFVYQHRAEMTVRDFLLLATKEKRAFSDVSRARADSDASRTFDFDIKKSARRRAQSAGDIWTSAVQSTSPTRAELGAAVSDESAEVPEDSNGTQETYENWTVLSNSEPTTGGTTEMTQPATDGNGETTQLTGKIYETLAVVSKTTDDKADITQADESSETNQPELEPDEEEKAVSESVVENSHTAAKGKPADGNDEIPIPATQEETDAERIRGDSSTSEGSYENVGLVSSLHSIVHDADSSSVHLQQSEIAKSSQDTETEMTASSSVIVMSQEDEEGDYVNIDRAFPKSSPHAGSAASAKVEQTTFCGLSGDERNNQHMEPLSENDNESSIVILKVDRQHTSADTVDGAALLSTPMSGSIGSEMDKSDTISFETIEEVPSDRHPPGNGHDEGKNESLSRSLVILEAKDNDSDNGSFETGTASNGDNLSIENADIDRVSRDLSDQQTKPDTEREGVLTLGSTEQSLTGTDQRALVQILPTLTYSDHSSLSSNDCVELKKEETVHASRSHEPQKEIVSQSKSQEPISGEIEESTPVEHSLGETGSLLAEDSRLVHHSAAQENLSPPPHSSPLRGLAALKAHPTVMRPNESETEEGMALSVEDIQRVLEGSDDSSEEDHGPPPSAPSLGNTPVKISLTEKFVFSEEDEDIDV